MVDVVVVVEVEVVEVVVVVVGAIVVVVVIVVVVTPLGSAVVETAARSAAEGVVPVAVSRSFIADSRAASSSVAAESRDSDSALRAAFSASEQVTVVVEMVVAKIWEIKITIKVETASKVETLHLNLCTLGIL